MKLSVLGAVCLFFPLHFSVSLSGALSCEQAWSVLLLLSGLGSDKAMLSTWPGQCYAESLVYGPSIEYTCPFQSPTTTETVQVCGSLFADIRIAAGTGLQLKLKPLVFQILVAREVCLLLSLPVLLKDKPRLFCLFVH